MEENADAASHERSVIAVIVIFKGAGSRVFQPRDRLPHRVLPFNVVHAFQRGAVRAVGLPGVPLAMLLLLLLLLLSSWRFLLLKYPKTNVWAWWR